jgi:hypothetical protein
MAQQVLVEMIDDVDGETATQTVPFSLDGVLYEIDLSDENATNLRDELARFIAAAQRTGGRKVRPITGQSALSGRDPERSRRIRDWAQHSGYELSTRGRLSVEILQAFEAAHSAPTPTKPAPSDEAAATTARKRAPRKKAPAKA